MHTQAAKGKELSPVLLSESDIAESKRTPPLTLTSDDGKVVEYVTPEAYLAALEEQKNAKREAAAKEILAQIDKEAYAEKNSIFVPKEDYVPGPWQPQPDPGPTPPAPSPAYSGGSRGLVPTVRSGTGAGGGEWTSPAPGELGSASNPISDPADLARYDLTTTPVNQRMTPNGPVGGHMPADVLNVNDPAWRAVPSAAGGGARIAGGVLVAGSAAGAVAMGIAGGALAAINANAAESNATIMVNANTDITDATVIMNNSVVGRSASTALKVTKASNDNSTVQNRQNNECIAKQRDNNYNTATTNAANNYNTDTGNNSRTYNTSVGNANRTYNTVVGNASRTCDTAISNAASTKNTSYSNALRTDDIAIINAKEILENTQDGVMYSMLAASKRNPIQLTQASGNAEMYSYGMNGIQFRLRTQSESAIKQTVAQFARFGYNLNQIWNVKDTGLNLMETFTYWKASDIWIDIRKAATFGIENALKNIFKNGVTVWKSPDLIGKVDIYAN